MTDDTELLRRYADDGSEPAFAELVTRNIDLVYAAAFRHVGEEHRAKDIAQTVFVDLARKARSLRHHPALASWLFTSTRYAALKSLRSERRRQAREHEAHLMQQISSSDSPPDWEQLRPLLDEVLHSLGESDREIVLLRYFRGLSFSDLSAQTRVGEGALRMRADRALDKMSGLLAKRGVNSTSAALGLVLGSQPLLAAPLGLAASASGAALSTATLSGIGTLFIMSKTKIALFTLVVAGGIATAVVENNRNRASEIALEKLASENDALRNRNNNLGRELSELRQKEAESARALASRATAISQTAIPSGSAFDGPLGNLRLLAEASKRGIVATPRYFTGRQRFDHLEDSFVKTFALTPQEVSSLRASMAEAQTKIEALTVANASATKGEDGRLTIKIRPTPDGTNAYESLLAAYRQTLGEDRYRYFLQLAGDQFEQCLGYFGAQERIITVTRNATGSSEFNFNEKINNPTVPGGAWGATGPIANRQKLEEQFRIFAQLIPTDF